MMNDEMFKYLTPIISVFYAYLFPFTEIINAKYLSANNSLIYQ